ncbi:hypothetical protein ACE1CI_17015 [Aerosakkonemataceae cyanobacterium BLCC-F50]|uniref:Uncharacterized protein n=1 Tax=Floridaenema flaviceps BLCC-F50 TaxID=3153642 RepID=A0ABV4XT31_9CYAN
MELDKIIKKLTGLYLGSAIVAVVVAILTLGESFVILLGIGAFGLVTLLGDAIAEYGVDAVLIGIYTERSKKESVESLLKEIDGLLITEPLKLKLKNQLIANNTTKNSETEADKVRTVIIEH